MKKFREFRQSFDEFYIFTNTQILREIEFWKDQNSKKSNFDSFRDFIL